MSRLSATAAGVAVTEAGGRYLAGCRHAARPARGSDGRSAASRNLEGLDGQCGPSLSARAGCVAGSAAPPGTIPSSRCASGVGDVHRFHPRGSRRRHSAWRGILRGIAQRPAMRVDFWPVCSPALLSRGPPLRGRPISARHVLLHEAWDHLVPNQLDWAHCSRRWACDIDARCGVQFCTRTWL